MDQVSQRSSTGSAPIPAARTLTALGVLAAAVTAFGLLTGNPEPAPARAAQARPEPAPTRAAQPDPAQATRPVEDAAPAAAEGDGNVFIYH